MTGRMGPNCKSISGFVMKHPEYLDVVKQLIASDGEWVAPSDLKKHAGIPVKKMGQDYANWLSFSSKLKNCGYIEIRYIEKYHTQLRIINDAKIKLQKAVELVEA